MSRAALAPVALVLLLAGSAQAAPARHVVGAAPGHRLAGFALDREWLVLANDPARKGACPLVELVGVEAGSRRPLSRPGGASCRFGGRFWVRPGARALGNAIVKALWILRNGSQAIAVKSSPIEQEVVLARVGGGTVLGPVVAKNWLRLFAAPGGVVSGNKRTLWDEPTRALGLDKEEHAVSVAADGSIAMWHAHGARYGRVADAHARAAALDDGTVYLLRGDAARLDVRLLSGKLVRSWPVARGAKPLLDVSGDEAVYVAGRAVHELRLDDGKDRVVARAPRGATLLDAQIEPRLLAWAERGGPAGRGRVVVVRR
ncbi:MAG TPA: hypothetical protein VFJ77_07230 [Gaiellaceae bacterium]|nr:hypothetical protein [Gaiellaceae bacterium]